MANLEPTDTPPTSRVALLLEPDPEAARFFTEALLSGGFSVEVVEDIEQLSEGLLSPTDLVVLSADQPDVLASWTKLRQDDPDRDLMVAVLCAAPPLTK